MNTEETPKKYPIERIFKYLERKGIKFGDGFSLAKVIMDFEIELIEDALRAANYNQSIAAKSLKLNRTTLSQKIKKFQISLKESK